MFASSVCRQSVCIQSVCICPVGAYMIVFAYRVHGKSKSRVTTILDWEELRVGTRTPRFEEEEQGVEKE